jgi:hypothetical protein
MFADHSGFFQAHHSQKKGATIVDTTVSFLFGAGVCGPGTRIRSYSKVRTDQEIPVVLFRCGCVTNITHDSSLCCAVKHNRKVKINDKDREKPGNGISPYGVNLGFKQPGGRFGAIFCGIVPGTDHILEIEEKFFFVIKKILCHSPAC